MEAWRRAGTGRQALAERDGAQLRVPQMASQMAFPGSRRGCRAMASHAVTHLTHLTRGMDHGGVIFGRRVAIESIIDVRESNPLFFTWKERCEGIARQMRRGEVQRLERG